MRYGIIIIVLYYALFNEKPQQPEQKKKISNPNKAG